MYHFLKVAVVSIACFGLGVSAAAQSTSLSYKGYLRGIDAMRLDFNINMSGAQFQLNTSAKTVGLAALAAPRDIVTQTIGTIGTVGLTTQSFDRQERKRGAANQINGTQVTLRNPDGSVSTFTAPAQAQGAVDPMATIGQLLWVATNSGRCENSRTVYDGRVLAQATMTTVGQENLTRSSRQPIAANTLKCIIQIQSLNDKRSDVPRVDVWMAPLSAGGMYMPIKMIWYIDGEQATFHLTDFR